MIYVTISCGIGAGVISDSEVLEGWNGNFGEIGHMKLEDADLECGCGGKDHWESYSSGDRMPIMARKLFDADFNDSREIFEEAEQDHPAAQKAIEKMQEVNSEGFANVINLFNPEIIWVGGAVATNHFQKVVEEPVEMIDGDSVNQKPIVRENSLGEEAVIHGLKAASKGEFQPDTN